MSYHLRPWLFFSSILLSLVMLTAAKWQWTRYKEKLDLVETFKSHKMDDSIPFEDFKEVISKNSGQMERLINKKVSLRGKFDFNNQVLVINRRTEYGAGSWILTPFKLADSDLSIVVSRGFIPYEEKTPESWEKYRLPEGTNPEFTGIVTQSTGKRSAFSPAASTSNQKHFLYPDMSMIANQIPYPVVTQFFIQGILEPVSDKFPLTDIKIDVPPSTHYWYTFEWIALALLTQVVCFLIQLFRPYRRIIPPQE